MKLFHFVCEKRLLNWLLVRQKGAQNGKKTDELDPLSEGL
jgi:hypothetical protein